MCTQHPEHFEWFPIRYDQVLGIKDTKHVFEGGYQSNITTYIGRVYWRGHLTVGKVTCWGERYCLKLTTVEGRRFYQHTKFEILIYNPTNETENFTATHFVEDITEEVVIHHDSSSWLWYSSLVLAAVLIVIVIIVIRRC